LTYAREGDRVILEMSHEDFGRLMLMLHWAAGEAIDRGDALRFYRWVAFVNEMNRTNPDYTPLVIPAAYQKEDVN
jgi:hypothetical protein